MRAIIRTLGLSLFIAVMVVCANAQGTSFTFQGKLTDTLVDASGPYDFTFKLFDLLAIGTQVGSDVVVNDANVAAGIFTVNLDFGAVAFTAGAPRFIQIEVRPGASTGTFTVLAPRQLLTSAPHAIKSLDSNQLGGVAPSGYIQTAGGTITGNLTVNGTISGNGSGVTNINGANIQSQSVTSVQIAPESQPNSTAYKLLGSLRWDLLKPTGTFAVGNNPQGVAFDGANVWVANGNSNNVTKLRVSDGAIFAAFAVGSGPFGIAFDGANVWVANSDSNTVTKLRTSDGGFLGTFAVGTGPQGVAFDGANIWVASFSSDTVTKLRAGDGVNLGTFPFPLGSGPRNVAFDGANVWVANLSGNTVTKLRAGDGANLGTFPVGSPFGVAFDGANVWVANFSSSTVTRLQPAFPQP